MSTSYYVMEPPSGQVRDLINPLDMGSQVVSAGIATTAIAFVVLSLRIFTRAYLVRNLGVDDYFAIAAMFMSVAFCATTLNGIRLGAGKHMWYMLVSNYSPGFLAGNIGITITYSTSVSFSKLSILIFYLRLSPKTIFRRTVYALIGVVCAYTIAYELIIIFQCTPIGAAWDITVAGNCIRPMVPMMTLSTANIIIDIVILVIPIKVFLELHMSKRQRISLMGLFGAGGFVCAVAIQRTVILPGLLNSADYTWDVIPQMIWGFLEVNTGVVCAALPALKPLFTRYLPRFLSSRSRQSGHILSGCAEPYSTSVERNRKRRLRNSARNADFSASASYVINHDQNKPRSPPAMLGDDEVNLWSPGKAAKQNGSTGHVRNLGDKLGEDHISMKSLEDSYSRQNTTRTVIAAVTTATTPSGRTYSDQNGCRDKDGIMVTRETMVGGGGW